MNIEFISLIVALIGIPLTLYIAYKSKKSSLESEKDRQQYLSDRLQNKKIIGEPTVINIDSVEFTADERSFKNWILEELTGESVVTFSFMNVAIDPDALEIIGDDGIDVNLDGVKSDFVDAKIVGDTVMTRWRINSGDSKHIEEFLSTFCTAIDKAIEDDMGFVRQTKRVVI